MKTKPICVALVGMGWAGEMHARAYNHVYGVNVRRKTVCALEDSLPAFAEKHGFEGYTESFGEVLDDPEIDVVDIATPPFLHRDMIVRAMRVGKDVICEKPLTGYFGEPDDERPVGHVSKRKMLEAVRRTVDEIEAVMKETGRRFFYCENWVYAPAFRRACALMLQKGTTIVQMDAIAGHKGSPASYVKTWETSGGGVLSRNLIHPLSAAICAKRLEMEARGQKYGVRSVACDCSQVMRGVENRTIQADPVDTEDWAHVVLTFADGTKATLTSGDTFVGESVTTFDMYGNDAVFRCRFSQADLLDVYFSDDRGIEDAYFVEKADTNAGHHRAIVSEEIIRGYYGEIQDFMECLRDGREPLAGFALARESTELVQLAYFAAEQNRVITLSI